MTTRIRLTTDVSRCRLIEFFAFVFQIQTNERKREFDEDFLNCFQIFIRWRASVILALV